MLAPDPNIVKEFLQNFLTSYQSITFSSISLRNARFFPLTPTPAWMGTLEENLGNAQVAADNFLITQGPSIVSQIPAFFITYSNAVGTFASNIQNAGDIQTAITDLNWLKGHIDGIASVVKTLNASLNAFGADFKSYKANIDSAIQSALADVKTDQAEVAQISSQIDQLMQDISAETVKVANSMTGVMTSGASLSFALLSWSFAVATTLNPALPIIGILVAVGGLTYGAITNAINEAKIADNLEQIKTLSGELLEENQSIAVLQTLTPMLQSVESSLDSISSSMDVSSIWDDESQKIDTLIATLRNYSGSDFKSLPDIASIKTAAETWATIAGWATNIQKSVTGISDLGQIDLNQNTKLRLV